MPITRTFVTALAAGLLAAVAGLAANHGVEALPGDRFTAGISPAGDVDTFVVPLGDGSRLSVDVRAAPGSALLPTLAIRSPAGIDGSLVGVLRGEGSGHLVMKNLPIRETGGWALIVGGQGTTTGAYAISFAAKSPARFAVKGLAVPSGEVEAIPFTAGDGAVLTFTVKAKGPRIPEVVSLRDPSGADFPLPPGSVVARGRKITGRAIPLAGPFGTWELRVDAGGGDVRVDAVLQVRSPKPRKLQAELGPEPRPSSLDPQVGRDGIPFSVAGQGFALGARVRFGETWAEGTVAEGSTGISGPVPEGGESSEGLTVAVVVANPDGQENAAPGSFHYLGIPRPESSTPRYQPPEGGYPLVIQGRNFRPGFSLSIGGVPRPEATLTPTGEIHCVAPAHALGAADIAVTDEFGRTGTLALGVLYVGPPVPVSVSPAASSFTGGRVHTLLGQEFRPGLRVFVDGVPCEGVVDVDATHVRFRMPAGPAGALDVAVLDEFDRTGTGPGLVRRRGPFVDASAAAVPLAPEGADFLARCVALGDLDGNGSPDLLLASSYQHYDPVTYDYLPAVRVLLNDGAGVFTDGSEAKLAAFSHPLDTGVSYLALLGDLDGLPGNEAILSSAYPIADPAYTFPRNGKTYAYATLGYYGSPYTDFQTYAATRILSGPGAAKLTEITASSLPAFGSTPYLGFGERWQAAAGAMGDLDGDGHADLVLSAPGFLVQGSVASTTYAGGVYYLVQSYQYLVSTRVLHNDGSGAFTTRAGDMPGLTFMNGSYATRVAEELDASAVALGDLDGDGDPDLVLTRSYPRLVYHLDTRTGNYSTYYIPAARMLRNDGTGKFARDAAAIPATVGSVVAGSPEFWQGTASALGDLDGDGDLDLVLGRTSVYYWYDAATTSYQVQPALRIFANDGSGKFAEATGSFLPAVSFLGGGPGTILDARSIALGDLDGDDRLDMVVSGQTYAVYSYAGAPYGPQGFLAAGERPATRIFLGAGAGKLEDQTSKWLPAPVNGDLFQADAAVLGDLDGDGDLDLVLASDSYPVSSTTPAYTSNRPLRILKCK